MHPVIEISIGGWSLEVPSYRLLLTAALMVIALLSLRLAGRREVSRRQLAWVLVGSALAAIAGARILAVATTGSAEVDLVARLTSPSPGDFALFGGLIAGGLAGVAVARRVGLDPLIGADVVAPAIGAGIVTMRVGCLLAGCCFGTPTHLPWGITYPKGSTAHLDQILSGSSPFTTLSGPQPVHPFPIYDMIGALVGALLASVVYRRGWRKGSSMAVFALWYSMWRLLIQPLRADVGGSLVPEWFWPLLFLGLAAAAGQWLLAHRKTRPFVPAHAH